MIIDCHIISSNAETYGQKYYDFMQKVPVEKIFQEFKEVKLIKQPGDLRPHVQILHVIFFEREPEIKKAS
jgi:hypothetical protein